MPDYKNPLVPRREKPKIKTYNMTGEQIDQMTRAAQIEGYTAAIYI